MCLVLLSSVVVAIVVCDCCGRRACAPIAFSSRTGGIVCARYPCWLYLLRSFRCNLSYLTFIRWLRATAGYRPFTDDNFNTFVEMATTMNNKVREHCDSPEYAILFQVWYTGLFLFCLPGRGWCYAMCVSCAVLLRVRYGKCVATTVTAVLLFGNAFMM
jgi:hypothetical protein